jgi:TBC1 domain family member 20
MLSLLPHTALSNPAVREQRRLQLQDLIVHSLRKYPSLHYFQGYHDIISVLLLTLSPQHPPASVDGQCDLETPGKRAWWPSEEEERLVRRACERVTLHVIRDSLTKNLDPIMGQLK